MNKKSIIIILIGLIAGTIAFVIFNYLKGDLEKYYYSLIVPFVIGVTLISISFSKKLVDNENTDKSQSIVFKKKYRIIFLICGAVSFMVFFLNVILDFSKTKPVIDRKGWTDELIKKEINYTYYGLDSVRIKFPKETYKYCDCAINKMKDTMTYKVYLDSFKHPTPTNEMKLIPIIQDCINSFKKSISENNSQLESIGKK